MTNPTPTCATCRWCVDRRCHRYPPTFPPWADDPLGAIQPEVERDDWCGEWQIRGPWIDRETGITVERVLVGMADVAAGRTVSQEELEREHP